MNISFLQARENEIKEILPPFFEWGKGSEKV